MHSKNPYRIGDRVHVARQEMDVVEVKDDKVCLQPVDSAAAHLSHWRDWQNTLPSYSVFVRIADELSLAKDRLDDQDAVKDPTDAVEQSLLAAIGLLRAVVHLRRDVGRNPNFKLLAEGYLDDVMKILHEIGA